MQIWAKNLPKDVAKIVDSKTKEWFPVERDRRRFLIEHTGRILDVYEKEYTETFLEWEQQLEQIMQSQDERLVENALRKVILQKFQNLYQSYGQPPRDWPEDLQQALRLCYEAGCTHTQISYAAGKSHTMAQKWAKTYGGKSKHQYRTRIRVN